MWIEFNWLWTGRDWKERQDISYRYVALRENLIWQTVHVRRATVKLLTHNTCNLMAHKELLLKVLELLSWLSKVFYWNTKEEKSSAAILRTCKQISLLYWDAEGVYKIKLSDDMHIK